MIVFFPAEARDHMYLAALTHTLRHPVAAMTVVPFYYGPYNTLLTCSKLRHSTTRMMDHLLHIS